MSGGHPSWEQRALGPALRPWQVHAVDALVVRLRAQGSRVCLVAPPGAGKTVCSLAVAARLGVPVEVRVPTTALVAQWQDRVRHVLVATASDASPPPIHVCTYAADEPFAASALVILDECHHLTAAWGAAALAQLTPAHRVLGLTATPPLGASGWDRFIEIVGDDPVEIAAPPLVRDGQLCPFADLAWPVLVDLDELGPLRALDTALAAVEARFAERFGLWETWRLRDDLWSLTEARFTGESGLLVALCRLRNARGAALPDGVVPDAELLAPPTLHDRALALWSFAPKEPELLQGLRAAGFRVTAAGPTLEDDVAWRSLAGTGARVSGAIAVLALEHRARGDGIRALVVCDRDAEGDRLAAREVLRALVDHPSTDPLDPVLVTGSVFWVDDDLWPRVEREIPELPWVKRTGHHEVDVTGWSTAERVALATRFLDRGLTRCLVGTRHLLGEGWDCPAVNVVIDLTGITTSVTVNQVRGRALRPHPPDPSKVASLWDVVALAPGVPDGDRMLDELVSRHKHTFGVDAEGAIRSGAGRIDLAFEGGLTAVLADLEPLRERVRARAGDWALTARRWAVGRDYRDARVWRTVGVGGALGASKAKGSPPLDPQPSGPASIPKVVVEAEARLRWAAGAGVSAGAILGSVGAALLLAWGAGGLISVAGGLVLLGLGGAVGVVVGFLQRASLLASVNRRVAVVTALHEALRALFPQLGVLHQEQDASWAAGDPAASHRFARALAELVGPIRAPRYLLVESDGTTWPIPEELGARRDLAEVFVRAWCARVGSATAVYVRNPEGRARLRDLWRAGAGAAPTVRVVETWE